MPNPIKTRLADLLDHDLFTPRELSWLSFNSRVLQEAADHTVPLIERLRYLGIFSNNSDEFFRVRVAEVRRLISMSSGENRQQSKDLLAAIQKTVVKMQKEFDRIYNEIISELAARRIYMINEEQLDSGQADFVQTYPAGTRTVKVGCKFRVDQTIESRFIVRVVRIAFGLVIPQPVVPGIHVVTVALSGFVLQ